MKKILDRLSYANVAATLALFVALGGTSYAVATLPKDSVGARQLRPSSVGSSELKRQAVKSSDIADRAVRLRDISKSAQTSLEGHVGPPGPPGPTFAATIRSTGGRVTGSQVSATSGGAGVRIIGFTRSVVACVPSATLTVVPGDASMPPSDARIRTEMTADGRVLVRTWDNTGAAQFYPFNLIVAC